jgi:activating signal cointegrator complex subunit 1
MPPRPAPTHFLCIPLITGLSRRQLSASLGSFKADVTSPESFAVPEQAIRPLGTLHLTLGVMSFPNGEGLDKAVALLRAIVPRQVFARANSSAPGAAEACAQHASATLEHGAAPWPLVSLTLKGLHSTHTPSQASALYAAPEDHDGSFFRFCEELRRTFQEAGLMADENRPLLLHATVINTIYMKGKSRSRPRDRLTLDARGMMDRYDDYVWMADVPLEKIAICRMGAKKLSDGDEAYEVEAEIDVA